MKATGIVRRIDELGRVVIPKEIRRTLRIREGDPLEIFTDRDGEVILKKYSPIGELGDFAKEYAESSYQALGHTAVICDKDAVIAVAGGSKRELMDKPISEEVERLMKKFPGLDCGSCGAPTCKALAEDIVRGEARETDCVYYLRENLHKLSEEVSVLADDLHKGDHEGQETMRILKEYIQRISEEMSLLDKKEEGKE